MRRLLCSFALAAYASMAHADNLGASYLGLCSPRWPCAESLAVFDGLPVKRIGWLTATFGDRCPCANRFLTLPGKKFVRVHLANCTCFPERGRRCGKSEPFYGETLASADLKLRQRDPTILRRYRRNLSLAAKALENVRPDTEVRLSLCLETDFSQAARRVLLGEARRVFPKGKFVDSVTTGPCLPGLACERHGPSPAVSSPCLTDTDGADFRRGFAANRCQASFLWEKSFNLLDDSDVYVDPRDRTAAPSRSNFLSLSRALRSSP